MKRSSDRPEGHPRKGEDAKAGKRAAYQVREVWADLDHRTPETTQATMAKATTRERKVQGERMSGCLPYVRMCMRVRGGVIGGDIEVDDGLAFRDRFLAQLFALADRCNGGAKSSLVVAVGLGLGVHLATIRADLIFLFVELEDALDDRAELVVAHADFLWSEAGAGGDLARWASVSASNVTPRIPRR